MEKRWNLLSANEEEIEKLQTSLKIHKSLCKLLVQRNIKTYEEAKEYFRPDLNQLHDPYLMKDMAKAISRLIHAFNYNEKILVFGDYDVDGTTSVALMYSFLKDHYDVSKVDFYVPHRYKEGYGISLKGIEYAKENGFSLIISLDCGIKSVELVGYAKSVGIDFIICDHHQPDDILPDASAILNPKQKDCGYPYKELCGCGVGFKFITAIAEKLNLPDISYLKYIDLVVTAIAADIVPVTGENRILAYFGLKKLNNDPCTGLKAIISLSGTNKALQLTNIAFLIAPRINAAGRMDDARKAILLFIESNSDKAMAFASMLHTDNNDRKDADTTITEEALILISEDNMHIQRKTTVVFQSHWHKGVVGIVASRLIEKYYRPTVVLTQSGDIVAGSARSVSGFNLYEAIHACRDHLLGYGGHFAAAGMTMLPESVEKFKIKFEEVVNHQIDPHLLIPEIVIDIEIAFNQITKSYYNIIDQMEPFGPGNCKPIFITRDVVDTGYSKCVKDIHLRFVVTDGTTMISGIGFNMGHLYPQIKNKEKFDIIYTLDINEWNGERHLQIKVIDIKFLHTNTSTHLTTIEHTEIY